MNHKERVLNSNGTFESFPERLEELAIKQGNKEAPADKGPVEETDSSGVSGKAEVSKDNAKISEAQKKVLDTIKQQQFKKASEK